jgi:DNA-binding NarL/FixJ family response regulator
LTIVSLSLPNWSRKPLHLLLVDDHALFRQSLACQILCHRKFATVTEAPDADTAIQLLTERPPDVVLMDVEMPGRDPFEAVVEMKTIDPDCKILFLSAHDCDLYVEKAVDIGANGYVSKQDTVDVLMTAISKVAQGGFYFSESILSRLSIEKGRIKLKEPANAAIALLTRRERQLLTHLGQGASLKEAAAAMHVSYKTADNQKASLMRKLNIHDRVELARFAIREKLVRPY